MKRIVHHVLPLWAGTLLATGVHAGSGTDPTDLLPPAAKQFLVPTVCVDASGAATAEDPYACLRGSRKLKYGEILPVRHFNRNFSGSAENFLRPIGDDSLPRIVTPYDSKGNAVDRAHPEGAFGAYDPLNDGFDVAGISGSIVSGIGTKLSKGLNLFLNGDCQLKNSWLLFDAREASVNTVNTDPNGSAPVALISFFDPHGLRSVPGVRTELISDRNWGLVNTRGCPADAIVPIRKSQSYGGWVYFPSFTYGTTDETGNPKNMPTLASAHYQIYREQVGHGRFREHFGHTEIVYYTSAYARIRWEAWNNATFVPVETIDTKLPLRELCNGANEYMDRNGDRMVRNTCAEWSNVMPAQYGGYDPRAWPGQKDLFFGNLLENGDFSGGCPSRIARSGDDSRCDVSSGLAPGAAPVFTGQRVDYAIKHGQLTSEGIVTALRAWDVRGQWTLKGGLAARLVWGEPSDPAQARWEFRKFHLQISSAGGSGDQALYQDIPVVATPIPSTPEGTWGPIMQRYTQVSPGSPLSFGGVFWASEPAAATLKLEELDAAGAVIQTASLPLKLSTAPQHFSAETVAKEPDAAYLRFAFIPGTPGASYNLDQLFMDQEKRY